MHGAGEPCLHKLSADYCSTHMTADMETIEEGIFPIERGDSVKSNCPLITTVLACLWTWKRVRGGILTMG